MLCQTFVLPRDLGHSTAYNLGQIGNFCFWNYMLYITEGGFVSFGSGSNVVSFEKCNETSVTIKFSEFLEKLRKHYRPKRGFEPWS